MIYLAYALLYAFVFFTGSCIGSFLNVIIYRVPRNISIAKGRSFCPGCHRTLSPWELVPIFSFLFLHGKCRRCKMKISRRYPLVESIMGIAALFIYLRYDFSPYAFLIFYTVSVLTATAFIDRDTMTIPNGLIIALILPDAAAVIMYYPPSLLPRIIGFFIISLPMLLLTVLIPESFGGGDIKLVAVCGFLLGWQNILLAAFLALLLGGSYGIYLLIQNPENRKTHIAFGPCLSIGICAAMLYGDTIIKFYLRFFSLY